MTDPFRNARKRVMFTERHHPQDPYYWWLSQKACEAIGPELPETFPGYLRAQYDARIGRPGRARLWEDPEICHQAGIAPWPNNSLTRWIESEDCGGIVFRRSDLHYVIDLPGIVTDKYLKRVGRS